MDKMLLFARDIANQIESFEKENNLKVDVLRWGIGLTQEGELSWGDTSERHVSIECRGMKE